MMRKIAMAWVFLYTAGLTGPQKVRRRDEIQSDMHEQLAFALEHGDGSAAISGSFASRTARGMLADVLWRLEEGRTGESVVHSGGEPPLPWFTMWFVSAIIVAAGIASTQVEVFGSGRVMLAFLAASGAGILWLGIYLVTHRVIGPVCIAAGTLGIVCGLWWTAIVPVAAVLAGVSALCRAHRLELILDQH